MLGAGRQLQKIVVRIDSCGPTDPLWDEAWPGRLERERIESSVVKGDAVVVRFQVFAVVAEGEAVGQIGGTMWGPVKIDLDGDPTNALIDEAYNGRRHLGDLYADLKGAVLVRRRWDVYSAPFDVELGSGLDELLAEKFD